MTNLSPEALETAQDWASLVKHATLFRETWGRAVEHLKANAPPEARLFADAAGHIDVEAILAHRLAQGDAGVIAESKGSQ